MSVKFSILVQPNPEWDEDSIEDQYIYCVLRSFDAGLTWHHFFTMVKSDSDEVKDFVAQLNKIYVTPRSEKISQFEKEYKYPKTPVVKENPSSKKVFTKTEDFDIHDD